MIGPSSRYGHATGLSHTYTPIYETVTLPIPKNHVLMCLIDAAQKSSGEGKDDEEYESGDDDELVLRGMQILGSSSGTYVVRERKGLMVYPFPPKKTGSIPANRSGVELVRYGQSVQISRYENKIATVARGAGYILVDDSSQLVKGVFVSAFA